MNKKQLSKSLISALSVLLLLSGCGETASPKPSIQPEDNSQTGTYSTQKNESSDDIWIKEINTAQKSLDIDAYLITKEDLANAILDAKKRGIDVKVITDSEKSNSKTQKEILDKFKESGIPIKINAPTGSTHLNFIIIDDTEALGGSYNYLEDDANENDPSMIMKKPDIVKEYSVGFNSMWDNANDFENY
ncbi:phospholipase D-like domain-containing protein [Clostridium sp. BL-8]|uniref:phospholipase D-like domain-containing protein n=1 Tax=Clostridium sp. BL-8 TaxID=349938 RepID=UPI00098CB340|nr:phospholipase D-like domain-containing protein [Clostridium sp. BL-8]OOM75988.1 phospholipase D precursor [Clostridium sp. BL-8]